MRQHTDLSHQIVDRAVTLASHSSWESLRLQDIAADLHISFDEAVVTGIYLVTFCCWLTDDSSRYQRTKRCLEKQLRLASILGFIK